MVAQRRSVVPSLPPTSSWAESVTAGTSRVTVSGAIVGVVTSGRITVVVVEMARGRAAGTGATPPPVAGPGVLATAGPVELAPASAVDRPTPSTARMRSGRAAQRQHARPGGAQAHPPPPPADACGPAPDHVEHDVGRPPRVIRHTRPPSGCRRAAGAARTGLGGRGSCPCPATARDTGRPGRP